MEPEPSKLYIPTESEGTVKAYPETPIPDEPFHPVPKHLRETVDLPANAIAPVKHQQSPLRNLRDRGLVSNDPTAAPSLARALVSVPKVNKAFEETVRIGGHGKEAVEREAKTVPPNHLYAFGKSIPLTAASGPAAPEKMVPFLDPVRVSPQDPYGLDPWTNKEGRLFGDSKEENKILDKISKQVGFDCRGVLTLAQKAIVRRTAQKMKSEIRTEEISLDKKWGSVRNVIRLMDTPHDKHPEFLRQTFPVHYRRFYPKDIVTPKDYYDPATLGGVFACADVMRMDYIDNRDGASHTALEQIQGIVIAGYLWAKIKCPTFFLSKGLAEAIDATDLPNDYAPPPLKWPLPSFALMLGHGMLQMGGQDVAAILYARSSDEFRISKPIFDSGAFDELYHDAWTCREIVAERPPEGSSPLQLLTIIMANGDTTTREFVDFEDLDYSPNRYVIASANETSAILQADCLPALLYAIKLLLVLQHSPGLVERTSDVVHEHGKPKRSRFDPNAKWSANFMGRNYRMRGAGGEGEGDKRPHLRRGHARRQHYGAGRKLIKDIWIEPVFVNRAKWKPGDPVLPL